MPPSKAVNSLVEIKVPATLKRLVKPTPASMNSIQLVTTVSGSELSSTKIDSVVPLPANVIAAPTGNPTYTNARQLTDVQAGLTDLVLDVDDVPGNEAVEFFHIVINFCEQDNFVGGGYNVPSFNPDGDSYDCGRCPPRRSRKRGRTARSGVRPASARGAAWVGSTPSSGAR